MHHSFANSAGHARRSINAYANFSRLSTRSFGCWLKEVCKCLAVQKYKRIPSKDAPLSVVANSSDVSEAQNIEQIGNLPDL